MILDDWIKEKHGIEGRAAYGAALPALLSQTVEKARASLFYKHYPAVRTLADFEALPFITADDLKEQGARMLCVSSDGIQRIVTQQTSGTTGAPKRLYFTRDDLEHTVDYFAHGMRLVAARGESCAMCLPCETPDGVGDLLARGLARMGATPLRVGLLRDAASLPVAQSVVGTPVQMLCLCALLRARGQELPQKALLSSDYVPRALLARLRSMGVEAYSHFGMTETGYGCAIDCGAHDGMHIRENDLYLEIVKEGKVVYDEWGELVVTTLNREAMPLLRYRTGDMAKLTLAPCACGSFLKRLWVRGRDARIAALDERLFACDGVLDYTARRTQDGLDVTVYYMDKAPALCGEAGMCYSYRPFTAFRYTGKRQVEA
ncbi:MAG: phenylacetate--CoA ligase family protein [Clostridia bacterium]|nr:phenylacetate--CoA ligase family protein [Clostridia bacterium]